MPPVTAPSIVLPTAVPPEALPGHMGSLRGRLEALRRKHMLVTFVHGVLIALGAAVAILAGEMLLDWLVDLPWVVRLLIFLGGIGAVGWLVRQRIVLPWRGRPGEDAVALMIERAMPIFRGRYICAVQLARDPAVVEAGSAPGLVRALVAQTVALADGRQYGHVISTRQLRTAAKRAVLGAALLIGAFLLAGTSGWILLRRAFLSTEEVPTKTRVIEVTGDRNVAIGDDLNIEASAAGLVPRRPGRLIVTETATKSRSEFLFEPVPGKPGHFAKLVTSVQRPFDYQVRLGDGHSAVFHVTTRPRPTVTSLEAEQAFPPYARMQPVRRSLNDLSLLAGSKLRLRCRASIDVKAGSVRLAGDNPPPPVPMQLRNPRELTVELPIDTPTTTGFSVSLVDPAGVETKDPTVYRIDVVPDQPPSVRITYPTRSEDLVTAQVRLLIAFEATDDIGIAKLLLHYKLTRGSDGATELSTVDKTLEMDLGSDRPRELKRRYEWSIANLTPPPAPGAVIEYWLEATDANNVNGPGIGRTDHFTARVVTDLEKRADLMNRTDDTLHTIGDFAGREDDLTKQLGGIITEKPVSDPVGQHAEALLFWRGRTRQRFRFKPVCGRDMLARVPPRTTHGKNRFLPSPPARREPRRRVLAPLVVRHWSGRGGGRQDFRELAEQRTGAAANPEPGAGTRGPVACHVGGVRAQRPQRG